MPLPADRVVINEWMASNTTTLAGPADGDFDDWFELYNPSPFPVDRSGYGLTDEPTHPTRFVCAPGRFLSPRGFLLVWADAEPQQNAGGRDLHVGFELPRAAGTIALFNRAGQIIDQIAFGAQDPDVSQGRRPDGDTSAVHRMPVATPRFENIVPEATSPFRILQAAAPALGTVTLTWTAEPGKVYRVQFNSRLDAASWTELAETMASDQTASVTIATGEANQRFYRIVVPK